MVKSTSSTSEGSESSVSNKSSLEVVIPSELDGSAYVQVEVRTVSGKLIGF